MLKNMKHYFYGLMTGLALLSACESGDVRNAVGLDRAAPDEFRVVSRPPLSVPPDFDLRPPTPGQEARSMPSTESEAKKLVFGEGSDSAKPAAILEEPAIDTAVAPVVSSELSSSAESNFLKKLGTDKADPEIRTVIHQDNKNAPITDKDASPIEKILGIDSGEPVVDAKAESNRIKANKEKGKPINTGKVKVVDPKKQSVLDKLLN